jgi:hypothetical protein
LRFTVTPGTIIRGGEYESMSKWIVRGGVKGDMASREGKEERGGSGRRVENGRKEKECIIP